MPALHLRGEEVLLDMFDEKEGVSTLMDFCTDIAVQFARAYLDTGIDVIAVVDPMISQIGPDHFEEVVAPSLTWGSTHGFNPSYASPSRSDAHSMVLPVSWIQIHGYAWGCRYATQKHRPSNSKEPHLNLRSYQQN